MRKRPSKEKAVMRSMIGAMYSKGLVNKATMEKLLANTDWIVEQHTVRMRKHTKPTIIMRIVDRLNRPISELFS